LQKVHSITSSARASSVGGLSIPSVFAVCRLIAISNLIGCWTESSAVLSRPPTRYRLTYKQCQAMRGQVKGGEKAAHIIYVNKTVVEKRRR
jgi:antirestriction protein ArdC